MQIDTNLKRLTLTLGVHLTQSLLIKIIASSVNSGDAHLRRTDPWFVRLIFGVTGPRKKILGAAFAGEVVAVGEAVSAYQVGNRVYGMSEDFMGCHAEYVVVTNNTPIKIMPETMTFIDAATLPFGGTTALHFLHDIDLQNKNISINGVSGSVGLCFFYRLQKRGAQPLSV